MAQDRGGTVGNWWFSSYVILHFLRTGVAPSRGSLQWRVCSSFLHVLFRSFLRDVYKKERKAALCECKVTAFLYGAQYLNVGIFGVFVVYICVYASFSGDLRELKWRDALFCGYYSLFVKNFFRLVGAQAQ